jgi:hypothetical protein
MNGIFYVAELSYCIISLTSIILCLWQPKCMFEEENYYSMCYYEASQSQHYSNEEKNI